MLVEGTRVPVVNRLMIDEERVLDIIDRMRVAVPREIKEARRIIGEQERLMSDAQNRVQQLMDDQGINAAIAAERERLLQIAEQEAADVRAGADEYAREVLQQLDEHLLRLLNNVRNGLETLTEE